MVASKGHVSVAEHAYHARLFMSMQQKNYHFPPMLQGVILPAIPHIALDQAEEDMRPPSTLHSGPRPRISLSGSAQGLGPRPRTSLSGSAQGEARLLSKPSSSAFAQVGQDVSQALVLRLLLHASPVAVC